MHYGRLVLWLVVRPIDSIVKLIMMKKENCQITKNSEIEAKFPCQDLDLLLSKIEAAGGEWVLNNSYERNILFDHADESLRRDGSTLRLRQEGMTCLLTWKHAQKKENGISYREEIETGITDFDQMQLVLERLGFQPSFIYEKYRTEFRLGACEIMLDRTPIGCFVEVEGTDEAAIRRIAEQFNLDWEHRSSKSYQQLFREWSAENAGNARDMLFESFQPLC